MCLEASVEGVHLRACGATGDVRRRCAKWILCACIHETLILEEGVGRERKRVADAHYGADGVGAGSQVCQAAQVLQRVCFLCQWIDGAVRAANDNHASDAHWGVARQESVETSTPAYRYRPGYRCRYRYRQGL